VFQFGSPEDTATLYWDEALAGHGGLVTPWPMDEMSLEELKRALVYARIALVKAWRDGIVDEFERPLLEQYDELFAYLASVSPEFRQVVKNGVHQVVGPYTRENIDKYKALAGVLD
jgi:hypothetical protein